MASTTKAPAKRVRIQKAAPPTKANLFILESMQPDDEPDGFREGRVVSDILSLCGKEADYRYIRTRQELAYMAGLFGRSDKRYLHISCHGVDGGLATTLDDVLFSDLGAILRRALRRRRLFVSACDAVTDDLANAVMRDDGCTSIVGPTTLIRYDVAAVAWAAFYQLMFARDAHRMKNSTIEATLRKLQDTFGVKMRFIVRTPTPPYWRDVPL